MLKRSSKKFAIMLVLTMLATMFVGVGTASAAGVDVHVSKILSVDKDITGNQILGDIQISEDGDFPADFVNGDTFVVTLPSGVKWTQATTAVSITDTATGTVTNYTANTEFTFSGSYTMNVTITGATANKDIITITPHVYFDGFSGGDVLADIDGLDSVVPTGQYLIAKGLGGGTETRVLGTATIGEGSAQKGAVVRVTETAANSLGTTLVAGTTPNTGAAYTEKITLTLPTDFSWNATTYANINALGAFAPAHIVDSNIRTGDTKKLDVYLNINAAAKGSGRGIIEVTPYIDVDSKATVGDVELDVEGLNDIDDATVKIATYADFDVTIEANDSTVAEVISGQTEQELTKIVIKENVAGSLVSNRNIEIELPSGVKFANNTNAVSTSLKAGTNIFGAVAYKDFDLVNIPVTGTSTSKAKLEISLKKVNIEGDFTGDIVVKVKGRAGAEGEVVVGKVVPALTGKVAPVDLKIGYKDQKINNIVLTEGKKGALVDKTLILEAPNGVTFNGTPVVKVTDGNLDIKDSDVKVTDNKSRLQIDINSKSNRVSEITISDVKLDIDRTVPEGTIALTLKGAAVAESTRGIAGGLPAGSDYGFNSEEAGDIVVANCVTPAPGDVANKAAFVIGSTTYTINGAENTMDVAPYIKDARTYMPIRYVANAMGISDNNIYWDAANQTVTLAKNNVYVQLKIGSKTILINGVALTMDVAPEITNDRTMLPARFVAEAFGANVGWDAATQTVTID